LQKFLEHRLTYTSGSLRIFGAISHIHDGSGPVGAAARVVARNLDTLFNKAYDLYNESEERNVMKDPASAVDGNKTLAALRNKATLESARAAGLLGHAKNARVAGRVSSELIAAAKKRAGLSSDTDVIEIALARLALEDDFGARLVRSKGSVPRDINIEI
jgi:hypothetical protein